MRLHLILLIVTFNALKAFGQTITASGPATFCQGGNVMLTAPSGSAYQWQKNGTLIPLATSQSYTANTSGNYTVTVTISGAPATTPAVTVTVNSNPVASFNFTQSNNTCSGSLVQFDGMATGGRAPYTYLWRFGDGSAATGQNPNHPLISLVAELRLCRIL